MILLHPALRNALVGRSAMFVLLSTKTRSALWGAGFPPSMAHHASPCVAFAEDIRPRADGSTPYSLALKEEYKGKCIPCGARVDFMQIPGTHQEKMDPAAIPGIFLGYHLDSGGKHRGECYVAKLDDVLD